MDKNKDNQAIQKQTANSASETPRSVDDAAGAVAKVIRNTETQNEIEKLEDRLKIAERWMIYLTAAIALFAFGSVLVGILQWNAMRGRLDEMKHGADDTAKQFRLMQASDVGVVSVSMIDRITSRFTITNFGNLTARNVIIRVKEDHFPSIHAMTFFQYDPLSELDSFRSDQTIQHHREALTRGESLETVSAIGPIWQSVGRLRHNDQLRRQNKRLFVFWSALIGMMRLNIGRGALANCLLMPSP